MRRVGIGSALLAVCSLPLSAVAQQDAAQQTTERQAATQRSATAPSASPAAPSQPQPASADALTSEEVRTAVTPSPAPAAASLPPPSGVSDSPVTRMREALGAEMAESGGLTVEQVARRAASTSVEAQIAGHRVTEASANVTDVAWGAVPQLTLSAITQRLVSIDPVTLGPPAEDGSEAPQITFPNYSHSLNARLLVPISDYLLRWVHAIDGAHDNEAAARLEERAARLNAAANAQVTYYQWVRAKLQAVLAERGVVEAEEQRDQLELLRRGGRVAPADVLQAEAFAASVRLTATQARSQERVVEQQLRIAIAAEPSEPLLLPPEVLSVSVDAHHEPVEVLLEEAHQKRLELQALEHRRSSLEHLANIEESRAWPTLDAVGNYTYANPNQRIFPLQEEWNGTWDVGLQMSWTLNSVGQASARGDVTRAQSHGVQSQARQVALQLKLEITTALSELDQARATVNAAERSKQAADVALSARQVLQQYGRATGLELLQARTALLRAQSSVIDAHIAWRIARVKLDHAVGRDVELSP